MTKKAIETINTEKYTWMLFAAVIVAVYFFALDVPLLGPDEPRYSQVAREMVDRGDLVTTTLGGYNWFEKPVLLYWLQIAFYSLFGVSEFSARFGSALFGLGTIASLWILGGSASGPQADERPLGNWFALVMATSLGLMSFARGASFDIIVTFPLTASCVAFYVYDAYRNDSSKKKYLALVLFWAFAGVALLAKGLIGVVFPVAIVTFYLLLSRRWPDRTLSLSILWGPLVAALVAGLWYGPMISRHGWEFIDEFFIQHHFQRFTSNKYRHPGPIWFFWAILPLMTIPWIPVFLVSVWKYLKQKLLRRSAPPSGFVATHPDLLRYAFAWALVPLVFFSLSGSKLPGYILPALPPTVVFTGLFVHELASRSTAWRHAFRYLAFAMLLVVAGILRFALPGFAEVDSTRGMIGAAAKKGYTSEKILNVNTISHNAEFYGAGRLVRDKDGRQWQFFGVAGVGEHMKKTGESRVLVLTPHHIEKTFLESDLVDAEIIGRDAELTMLAVKAKGDG